MDRKLPEDKMPVKPGKVFVRLSKSQLNGSKPFYRGTLVNRRTLSVKDIADRVVQARTSYRRETLIDVYTTMTNEIYEAIRDGFNVDMGIARTEMVVHGSFASAYDRFDRNLHSLHATFRPSPRLNQLCDSIPAETQYGMGNLGPGVNEISVHNEPFSPIEKSVHPFNTLPAGYDLPLFLHGQRLKLMGDSPEVGLTLRCLDTGEEAFIHPRRVFINNSTCLCFQSPLPLTPGDWQVVVTTQYNHSYRLYQQPRMECHDFFVIDTSAPERE